MGYPTGSIFAGLLKGIAQAKGMKWQQEQGKEAKDLQMELMKIKIGNQKLEGQKLKLVDMLAQSYFKKSQQKDTEKAVAEGPAVSPGSTAEGTPMGESFGKGGQLTKQLSGMQLPPEISMLLGSPFSDIAEFGQRGGHYGKIEQQADARLEEQKRGTDLRDADRDRSFEFDKLKFKTELGIPESYIFTGPDGRRYQGMRNKVTKEKYPVTPIPQEAPGVPAGESAGKIAAMTGAGENIKTMISLIFGADGETVNKQTLLEMSFGGGIGNGRKVISNFKQAIDGIIRLMTGAAVREDEWPFYEQQFLPSMLDLTSPGLVEEKLTRFDNWVKSYLGIMDPTGKYRKRAKDAISTGDVGTMSDEELLKELSK